ncbi:MAG: hypothetical protein J6J21_02120, partial [Clostridia bacterium]|nr:hypothetical protein [Clostridia bacterium]
MMGKKVFLLALSVFLIAVFCCGCENNLSAPTAGEEEKPNDIQENDAPNESGLIGEGEHVNAPEFLTQEQVLLYKQADFLYSLLCVNVDNFDLEFPASETMEEIPRETISLGENDGPP